MLGDAMMRAVIVAEDHARGIPGEPRVPPTLTAGPRPAPVPPTPSLIPTMRQGMHNYKRIHTSTRFRRIADSRRGFMPRALAPCETCAERGSVYKTHTLCLMILRLLLYIFFLFTRVQMSRKNVSSMSSRLADQAMARSR